MTKGILHFEDLDPKMFEAMCCNIIAVTQGHVIDIMTFNSYSLQNYSFWKGTRIIGLFSLSHEQNLTFRLSERKIKLA